MSRTCVTENTAECRGSRTGDTSGRKSSSQVSGIEHLLPLRAVVNGELVISQIVTNETLTRRGDTKKLSVGHSRQQNTLSRAVDVENRARVRSRESPNAQGIGDPQIVLTPNCERNGARQKDENEDPKPTS